MHTCMCKFLPLAKISVCVCVCVWVVCVCVCECVCVQLGMREAMQTGAHLLICLLYHGTPQFRLFRNRMCMRA